jgi:3-oxoacyl-[acyl-carrier-protein] synthase-3
VRVVGDLSVLGTAVALPSRRQSVSEALRQGWAEPDHPMASEDFSVPVCADEEHLERLCLQAASDALAVAQVSARNVDILVQARTIEGDRGWRHAPRLARLLGCHQAVALGVRQLSNGGAMALHLASAYLQTDPDASVALVVTGDTLAGEHRRRWESRGLGGVLGDGATAVVVGREGGHWRLRALASRSLPRAEGAYLHDPGVRGAQDALGVVSLATLMLAVKLGKRSISDSAALALTEAGVPGQAVRTVLGPRLFPQVTRMLMPSTLSREASVEHMDLTFETGHLFAGDTAANLHHLNRSPLAAEPGHALVVSIGMGAASTSVVLSGPSVRPIHHPHGSPQSADPIPGSLDASSGAAHQATPPGPASLDRSAR